MKKNLLLFFLLSVVGVVSSYADTWTDGNGIVWSYTNVTGGVRLSGASNYGESFSIPSQIDGENIISIESWAFDGCKNLVSIGDLPACTSIGFSAFQNCSSLTSVGELPACTSIVDFTFSGCSSLTSIGDLSACTSIGDNAFQNCSSLTSIGDLPACTSIAGRAFCYCSSLTSIGDLSACTSIGYDAFNGTSVIKLSIGSNTTLGNTDAISECTTILVPPSAVETYKSAPNWSALNSRIIPNNVQTDWDITVNETPATGSAVHNLIREENLANVMSLKITGNINGSDIFVMRNKMPNLHFIDLTDANIVASDYKYYGEYSTQDNVLGDYCFYEQRKLVDVKLPNNITSIGANAFSTTNLISVEIPEGVTSIGGATFNDCNKLSNVQFPSTLETIGSQAFQNCRKLKNLILPDNLKTIHDWAFGFCGSLTEVRLPSSLQEIGYDAFNGCSNLLTVRATAIDPKSVTMSDNSFEEYANATLYIPYDEDTEWTATRDAYYWHSKWGQFGTMAVWKPTYESVSVENDYNQDRGTIPGVNIGANFGNNSGYHLGQWAQQGFDKMTIKHNGKDGASIIDDANKLTANQLNCDITVAANKWYFFCFPFDVNLDAVTAPGESVWRKYDAAVRASNGNGGWQKLGNSEKTLRAGKGYIFQCNTAGTLVITINNPSFNADNKSAQLEENVANNAQDASWNFIGNPFLSYYELEDLGHDAPVTIWNGSGYEAVRPGDDDYALQPFQAFFVQKTAGSDEVTVEKDKRETKKQSEDKKKAKKASRAQQRINPDRLLVNLELTDGQTIDKTRVVFNDRQQMEYEPECDAAKFMSTEQVPQLYTYYNNVKYAINERPNSNTEVRLAFQAPKAGEYTISVTRMDTPMLLKDTELGITFDFQVGSYTFESKAGTNDKRFVLVKNTSATAIQPTTIGEAENPEFFNLAGQKTNADAKGVVISNGKKVLNK